LPSWSGSAGRGPTEGGVGDARTRNGAQMRQLRRLMRALDEEQQRVLELME
jgi:hypothetical protein